MKYCLRRSVIAIYEIVMLSLQFSVNYSYYIPLSHPNLSVTSDFLKEQFVPLKAIRLSV